MRYAIEQASGDGHEQAVRMLGELLGGHYAIEHDKSGAPFLPDLPHLHISISHCRKAVAVAVSETGRVGIDVESQRRVSVSLMERVCTATELESIGKADRPDMRFLQLWTRKEAVLKCLGSGIKGFGSLTGALTIPGITVEEVPCPIPGTVVSIACETIPAGQTEGKSI